MMQRGRPGAAAAQVAAGQARGRGKAIEADVKKYVEEAHPLVRERAIKLAPSTIGPVLEEKFTEDELKQLIAWLESPTTKKYQQLGAEMQQQLRPEAGRRNARPILDPKLKALDGKDRAPSLGVPARRHGVGRTPRRRRRHRPAEQVTAAECPPWLTRAAVRPPTSSRLRGRIDAVDRELLDLLNRRAALAQRVGELKSAKARRRSAPSAKPR